MPTGESVEITLQVATPNGRDMRQVVAVVGATRYPDVFNTDRADARRRFIVGLAGHLGIDRDALDGLHQQIVNGALAADNAAIEADEQAAQDDDDRDPLADVSEEIGEAAQRFLENPRLFAELEDDAANIGIVREPLLSRSIYLAATSRLLDCPLSASVVSASSSGKSFVTGRILSLFPEEDLIQATDMTPQSLYYMEPGSLCHKIVMVAERKHTNARNVADMANSGMALREMISSGSLHKLISMKGADGEIVTRHIHQDGPICYIETTTQEVAFDEDASRLLFLTTDESAEQTGLIMALQAQTAAGRPAADVEEIRLKHQTAQRMLRSFHVRIPYAARLQIPTHTVVARRAFPQLLGMIESVALLRQFQKHVVADQIEADLEDYRIAHELMVPILHRALDLLNEKVMELYVTIQANTRNPMNPMFTRADVQRWSGLRRSTAGNRLDALVETGLIRQRDGGQGRTSTYEAPPAGQATATSLNGLITPEELGRQLGA